MVRPHQRRAYSWWSTRSPQTMPKPSCSSGARSLSTTRLCQCRMSTRWTCDPPHFTHPGQSGPSHVSSDWVPLRRQSAPVTSNNAGTLVGERTHIGVVTMDIHSEDLANATIYDLKGDQVSLKSVLGDQDTLVVRASLRLYLLPQSTRWPR